MKDKRLISVSIMNTVFCLFVMTIHILSEALEGYAAASFQHYAVTVLWRALSFVMQGFVFLSGYKLILKKEDFSYGRYILGRLKTVVLPYTIWFIIYYIFFVVKGYFDFNIRELIKYFFVGNLVSPFYFIAVIMQFYILAPLWRLLVKKINPVLLIAVSFVITVFCTQYFPLLLNKAGIVFKYNDRVFTSYLIYWILGCVCSELNIKKVKTPKIFKVLVTIAFGVLLLCDTSLYCIGGMGYHLLETVHLLYAIFAIFFFKQICERFDGKVLPAGIKLLDRSTYRIFLCHCLFIFAVNGLMTKSEISSISLRLIIRFIIVFAVSIAFSMVIQKLKERLIMLKNRKTAKKTDIV